MINNTLNTYTMQNKKLYITPGTTVVVLNAEVHLMIASNNLNPGWG